MQLNSNQVTVMLPVRDLVRARDFYERALELSAGDEKTDGKVVYRCDPAVTGTLEEEDNGSKVRFKFEAPKTQLVVLIIDGILDRADSNAVRAIRSISATV